jgi:hypothetical protein
MTVKLFAGIIAAILLIGFLGSIAFKLKEVSLTVVMLIGVVMMLVELWETLQGKEE